MTDVTATQPCTAVARPRLYYVPPAGLGLAERAQARRQTCGQRVTRPYHGYDEDTPERAGFNAGMAYGVWGVGAKTADTLASLTYHLTAHAMRVVRTHRYIVTAALVGTQATVSVLALDGRIVADIDPSINPPIADSAQLWGWSPRAAGPCLYAGLSV